MYALATWYLFGVYVKKDYTKGNELLKKACDRCIPEACFDLANSYESGFGIEKILKSRFNFMLKVLYIHTASLSLR